MKNFLCFFLVFSLLLSSSNYLEASSHKPFENLSSQKDRDPSWEKLIKKAKKELKAFLRQVERLLQRQLDQLPTPLKKWLKKIDSQLFASRRHKNEKKAIGSLKALKSSSSKFRSPSSSKKPLNYGTLNELNKSYSGKILGTPKKGYTFKVPPGIGKGKKNGYRFVLPPKGKNLGKGRVFLVNPKEGLPIYPPVGDSTLGKRVYSKDRSVSLQIPKGWKVISNPSLALYLKNLQGEKKEASMWVQKNSHDSGTLLKYCRGIAQQHKLAGGQVGVVKAIKLGARQFFTWEVDHKRSGRKLLLFATTGNGQTYLFQFSIPQKEEKRYRTLASKVVGSIQIDSFPSVKK